MRAFITAPRALTKPQLPDGSTNPMFFLITDARNMGVPVDYKKDTVHIGPVVERGELQMEQIKQLVSIGCEIEGYPVFASLTPTAYAKEVPEYMPNRTYMEGEEGAEVEVVHTWETYPVSSREEIDGKHYIACSSPADYWPASLWTKLDGLAGVNIISVEDYKALQPTKDAE